MSSVIGDSPLFVIRATCTNCDYTVAEARQYVVDSSLEGLPGNYMGEASTGKGPCRSFRLMHIAETLWLE